MAQVINSGSLVKVKTEGHAREGQAGRTIGGSVAPGHKTVDVLFDLDQTIESVKTDDLTVLGT